MAKKRKPRKKGMMRAERESYNHWLWNLEARDFNKMSQQELAKIAGQYQRQFAKRARDLDKLQAETGIASEALRVARSAFENTRFLIGPQFMPSSHIVRNGKIRYSVPQLRSIVANYAHFFREAKPGQETIRTNTVEGARRWYEEMKARLEGAHKKVMRVLKGQPGGGPATGKSPNEWENPIDLGYYEPEELTPADFQAMWKAYDLFKEIYVEAFAQLQSDRLQEIMYQTYQEAPAGSNTMELVERMFEKAFNRVALNGDLAAKYRDESLDEGYYWGDELEKHLAERGFNVIKWRSNL